MSCQVVIDAIAKGASLKTPQIREHAATCAECSSRVAVASLLEGGELSDASCESWNALEGRLAVQSGLVGAIRGWRPSVRLGLLLAVAYLLALTQLTNLRVDFQGYPPWRMWGTQLVLGGLLVWGMAAALRPLYRAPLPRWLLGVLGAALFCAPFFFASLPAAHTGHALSHEGLGDDLWPRALACFLYGAAFSVPAWAVAIIFVRTGALKTMPLVLTGLAAGALGNFVLQLHCPLTGQLHLGLGHASIGLFLLIGAMAWLLIPRVLSK